MDYLEFIARVVSHIPDKGQVMIRYYGLYSNAHRGRKCKGSKIKVVYLDFKSWIKKQLYWRLKICYKSGL